MNDVIIAAAMFTRYLFIISKLKCSTTMVNYTSI